MVINTYTLFCQKLLQSKNVMNKFRWFVSSMHCFNVFISAFDPVLFLAMFGHSILSHILIVTVSEKAKKGQRYSYHHSRNCGNSHTFLKKSWKQLLYHLFTVYVQCLTSSQTNLPWNFQIHFSLEVVSGFDQTQFLMKA